MFSIYHFIWLAVCIVFMAVCFLLIKKFKPDFRTILNAALAISILSEITKILSAIEMIPLSDGSGYVPYLELNHLPLHLCSIQIMFIIYVRFSSKGSRFRHIILTFMYAACVVGATAALMMPSIFSTTLTPEESFTHPMAYQFFLFHAMLIVLGVCIYRSEEVGLVPKDYLTTMITIVLFAVVSVYANSIFAMPEYENGALVSIDNHTNFFFSYVPPIPVALTSVGQWVLYLAVLFLAAAVLVAIAYIPVFVRARRHGRK